jgi:hypothetical protein
VGSHRRGLAETEGDTFGVGTLVYRRRSRHREHRAKDDPRLSATAPARVDLATIRQAIVATHRALQLLQLQLEDKNRQKLRRLAQRLLNVDHELDHLSSK